MPKERPILFSSELVQTILAGHKTQTRRVIKPQPVTDILPADPAPSWWTFTETQPVRAIQCPYGDAGDTLWVRETWQAWTEMDDLKPSEIPVSAMAHRVNYLADGNMWDAKVRPSIFMPRWASRITLQVTDVRVERVQDISENDAKAEGCATGDESRTWFRQKWDEINAKRGYSWESNPWVWVVSFVKE